MPVCSNSEISADSVAEPFKRGLGAEQTIKLRSNNGGPGLRGFEGPILRKTRLDNEVDISSAYCGILGCAPFGKTLPSPIPDTVTNFDDQAGEITLVLSRADCIDGDTVALPYRNDLEPAAAVNYLELDGSFRECASAKFASRAREEVEQIFGSVTGG